MMTCANIDVSFYCLRCILHLRHNFTICMFLSAVERYTPSTLFRYLSTWSGDKKQVAKTVLLRGQMLFPQHGAWNPTGLDSFLHEAWTKWHQVLMSHRVHCSCKFHPPEHIFMSSRFVCISLCTVAATLVLCMHTTGHVPCTSHVP